MKAISLKKSLAAIAVFAAFTFTSCKNNEATETTTDETVEPVVTTEGDTVHIDTSKVPTDSGKATKPLIRKNSEDGTNSAL